MPIADGADDEVFSQMRWLLTVRCQAEVAQYVNIAAAHMLTVDRSWKCMIMRSGMWPSHTEATFWGLHLEMAQPRSGV